MKILNSFSINMLPSLNETVVFKQIYNIPDSIRQNLESCIGHEDTAIIISNLLGVKLPTQRVSVKLKRGEKFIVAQYIGPRLPEGCTILPSGSNICFAIGEVYSERPFEEDDDE